MINHATASCTAIIGHNLGNKSDGDTLTFSKDLLHINEDEQRSLLQFFTKGFKVPLFHQFTFQHEELHLNPVYNYVSNIFDDPESFYEHSIKLTRLLYDKSTHPNIKQGDFYIAYIKDLLVDDCLSDAIVLLKTENQDGYFKLDFEGRDSQLRFAYGTSLDKQDKICIVINEDRDSGYKVLTYDQNKNGDTKYWKDDFLILREKSNAFYDTKETIKLATNFIKKRVSLDEQVSKADAAIMLKETLDYFKKNEQFDTDDFKQNVLKQPNLFDDFDNYKFDIEDKSQKLYADKFAVSEMALRKQMSVFKSIIKLDKNFHIYIHGDHSKIQKCEDHLGRKYYALYYDEET